MKSKHLPHSGHSIVQVNRITDLQGFSDLQLQWSALLQENSVRSAFLSWEWNYSWWQAYSTNKKLWLLTIHAGDDLVGIAPLVLIKKRKAGIRSRVLTNLGDESLDVGGFIIPKNDPNVYSALVDYLFRHQDEWDVLVLNEFLQADPGIKLLKGFLKKHGLHAYQQERLHYYLPLEGTWKEYLASLSQNLRGDLRRKIHRAEKLGRLQYIHHRGSEVSKEDLEIIYQINASGRHSFLYQSAQEKKFQEKLRQTMQSTGWMEVHLLKINDKPVAYRSGFYFEKRIEDWRNAFNINFFELSAGKILLSWMIEAAFNTGGVEVDFLRGEEDYKARWKTSERVYLHLRFVCPQRFPHWLIYFFLPKIKLLIKKLFKHIPR